MKQKIECLLAWLDENKARKREQKAKRDEQQTEELLDRIIQNEENEN